MGGRGRRESGQGLRRNVQEARALREADCVLSAARLPVVLPRGWHVEHVSPGVNPLQPGLYEWRIEGVGVYIGQYTRTVRPRREYARNVTNILNARPYRKGKPDRFRPIHVALAEAVRAGRAVALTFIENAPLKVDRNRRERELVAERRRQAS